MTNITNTLTELKAIITDLKTQADKGTKWTGNDKKDIETRINHLLDKNQPRHTNLTADLDTDLKDLSNIASLVGQNQIQWATEKSTLEKQVQDIQKERGDKNTLISQKDQQLKDQKEKIADKLTTDLITKLEKVANSTPADQTAKLTELKTLLQELKTSGIKADLTDLTAKIDNLKTDNKTDYWSIGAVALSALSLIMLLFLLLKPTNQKSNEINE